MTSLTSLTNHHLFRVNPVNKVNEVLPFPSAFPAARHFRHNFGSNHSLSRALRNRTRETHTIISHSIAYSISNTSGTTGVNRRRWQRRVKNLFAQAFVQQPKRAIYLEQFFQHQRGALLRTHLFQRLPT